MAKRHSLRLPDRSMAEINITPLIDVMLALLVMFMIAAPLMTGAIHLPFGAGDAFVRPPKVLQLSITADGTVQGHGVAMSEMELQAEVYAFAAQEQAGILQLQPANGTHHQRLIDLLALANSAGLHNISIERPID